MKRIIIFVLTTAAIGLFASAAFADTVFRKTTLGRNSHYVAELYQDLLGRSPQSSEVKVFLSGLGAGQTRAALSGTVLDSTEYRSALIGLLYTSFLNRSVDDSGLQAALALFASGGGVKEVRASILSSNEYYTNAGGTDTGLANSLYQKLLGRDPTNGERNRLVRDLGGNTPRATVIGELMDDNDYRTARIRAHYNSYLGRQPTTTELSTFLAVLNASGTEEQVQKTLLGSEEYFFLVSPGLAQGKELRVFLGNFSYTGTLDLNTVKIKILWGDGRSSKGEAVSAGTGQFAVFGTHRFRTIERFRITITAKIGNNTSTGRTQTRPRVPLAGLTPFAGGKGGVFVAAGDFNGDTVDDIVAGAGPNVIPQVKVFNGLTGAVLLNFLAYEATFKGGVSVAVGDINGDGTPDIITGAGAGGSPHVKVFSGVDASLLDSFFAFETSFTGGVTVAVGDVNGDGQLDIITGAGPGGGPHVSVFSGTNLSTLQTFFAYDTSFTGGVFVAAGDLNGDGTADIITGAGAGGGPHVKVFDGTNNSTLLGSFFPYAASFSGGVRVAVGDIDGDNGLDIVTAPGQGSKPHVKVFDGVTDELMKSFLAFESTYKGGVYVATGDIDGDGKHHIISASGQDVKGKIKIGRVGK